jgi:hypothetical protein
MQKLMSLDSLQTLFAFAPVNHFLWALKSSWTLDISHGLVDGLQT